MGVKEEVVLALLAEENEDVAATEGASYFLKSYFYVDYWLLLYVWYDWFC